MIRRDETVLLTGGAGFIGCNLARRLAEEGYQVRIVDNLSRRGSERNLRWLTRTLGDRSTVCVADVRDARAIESAVRGVSMVFHLAAQVAVTTSLRDPRSDCDVNIGGTLNVLEAVRALAPSALLVFASTNKVYGDLGEHELEETGSRYLPPLGSPLRSGVSERQALSFHSPYGCSKGAAEQYVLDYSRSFALDTVVLRLSCIYGPRQRGNEDQGWVAHFLDQALHGHPLTVFGDGKQVRDLLYIDDLVQAFLCCRGRAAVLRGRAFNLGGGPRSTVSLLELLGLIQRIQGELPAVRFDDWRKGDQRFYVSDTRAFREATGWQPLTRLEQGIGQLHAWLRDNALERRGDRSSAYRRSPSRSPGPREQHQDEGRPA